MTQPSSDMTNDPSSRSPEAVARLERRYAHRQAVQGVVTVLRQSSRQEPYRFPVCTIQLRDLSDEGVGAHSETELTTDESVTVFIPPHGAEPGIDLMGHVVRCLPDENGGYDVGIMLHMRCAA